MVMGRPTTCMHCGKPMVSCVIPGDCGCERLKEYRAAATAAAATGHPPPQPPPQPTPLTADEYDVIKDRTGRLFMLYNLCAARGLKWHSDHKEVRDLMDHLDQHFPGNDLVLLLAEVSRLRSLLEGQQAEGGSGVDRPPTWYVDNRAPPPKMTDEEERALLAKAPEQRTRSEVWYLKTRRAVYGGCCNRFADNSGCDCEERALPG